MIWTLVLYYVKKEKKNLWPLKIIEMHAHKITIFKIIKMSFVYLSNGGIPATYSVVYLLCFFFFLESVLWSFELIHYILVWWLWMHKKKNISPTKDWLPYLIYYGFVFWFEFDSWRFFFFFICVLDSFLLLLCVWATLESDLMFYSQIRGRKTETLKTLYKILKL